MKNIVRALVLALTVTGSVAYTQIDNSSTKSLVAKANCMPLPTCEPGTGDSCGIGKR